MQRRSSLEIKSYRAGASNIERDGIMEERGRNVMEMIADG